MPTTSVIFENYGPIALIPFLFGPMTIGFYGIVTLYGKEGMKNFYKCLTNWRINPKWYLFALFTIPTFITLWLLLLNAFSDSYMPEYFNQENKVVFVVTGILTGLIGAGILEEFGWTGFATPLLRKKYSVLKTGLILGFMWGLWHFLPVFWASGDENGIISWSTFLPGLFSHYAVLIPFRIIQVWLHERTKSILPVSIFHITLTTFALFILRISSEGVPVLVYYAGIAVFLWGLVGLLIKKGELKKINF